MRHLLTYIGVVYWATAAQGSGPADPKVAEDLAKATAGMRAIATEGGYLWRYSEDLGLQ